MISKHTYITGGNSECEFFGADNVLDAERSHCNCETCNTHNMLKLTRELYRITSDKKYADYYETTFINAIMASVNEDTGMTTYFQPMATGFFKVYCNADHLRKTISGAVPEQVLRTLQNLVTVSTSIQEIN